jgi:hypothetical protein
LESNWLWNGFVNGNWPFVIDMAAHLVEPVFGLDWLIRFPLANPQQIGVAAWDSSVGFVFPVSLGVVPATGFPYGFEVDQTRLVL